MVECGLIEEARAVSHLRHLNSLNTVGYKELWPYIDGETTLDEAIAKIARNTRVYAKKQLTWLKNRPHRLIISNEQEPDRSDRSDMSDLSDSITKY